MAMDTGLVLTGMFVFGTAPGSPPQNVMARPVSSTTIMVSWEEPEIPNGVIKVSNIYKYQNLKKDIS